MYAKNKVQCLTLPKLLNQHRLKIFDGAKSKKKNAKRKSVLHIACLMGLRV